MTLAAARLTRRTRTQVRRMATQSALTLLRARVSSYFRKLRTYVFLASVVCLSSGIARAQNQVVLADLSERSVTVENRTDDGLALKALVGSEIAAKAIGGTGRTTKAIGGTGRTTKAIGGTGRTTKAIGGTGRTTKAIGGTGRTTKAIGGTGRTTKAIGGTGRATKAIGGTGRVAKLELGASLRLNVPLVRGPVEAWDRDRRNLRVLGQQVHVDGTDQFAIGEVIVVEGRIDDSGAIAADYVWADHSEQYVSGSSEVVVTGQVRSVDAATGRMLIGNLSVDYTQLLWDNTFIPTSGSVVTVVGIQANVNGELQARQADFR